ncbi:hypothetical protein K7G98_18645 [Saccharothrix sp. MB29]|nr:hypothetical protein [Saccharothrix sp. MB29]
MVGTRLLLGAFWLATLFLAVAFRDEAPGALPAVLAEEWSCPRGASCARSTSAGTVPDR